MSGGPSRNLLILYGCGFYFLCFVCLFCFDVEDSKCFLFLHFFLYTGVCLIYSVVLVSGVQQSHLVIHTQYLGRRQWHPTPVLLPGKFHGWRSLVGRSPWGCEESGTTERLHFHFSFSRIGERNDNPLQCSCLQNPGDGGAWWAAISGVTQSQTRLKQLSSSSSRSSSSSSSSSSLARSRRFQEHIQERARVLAPGMSLRLEVAACLLAACL